MGSEHEAVPSGRNNLLTLVLLLLILLMAAYAVFGNRGVLRILQAQRQQQELQQRLDETQQQQQELRQEIERLKHDRDYWEQLARARLGMVREGELIYFVPPETMKERDSK